MQVVNQNVRCVIVNTFYIQLIHRIGRCNENTMKQKERKKYLTS